MPVTSGTHSLSIQATYYPSEDDLVEDSELDGIILQHTHWLEVSPLGVDMVDLQIDQGVAQAGENVPYKAVALDRYGNEIQDTEITANIEVFTNDPDLTITTSQIYSTIAIYGVTGMYGEWVMGFIEGIPDDADSITLIVQENVEKYDSVQYVVLFRPIWQSI